MCLNTGSSSVNRCDLAEVVVTLLEEMCHDGGMQAHSTHPCKKKKSTDRKPLKSTLKNCNKDAEM